MGIKEQLSELEQSVIDGKHLIAEELTKKLLTENVDPKEILDNALMKGMAIVGERFRDQKMFVPQVLVSARAMKFSMKVLEPVIAESDIESKGKVLIGTVKGDVHDIGKNLVAVMLQGAGYDIIDIGIGCSKEKFFEEYEKNKPDIIGMSALLTTTMVYMKEVIEYFQTQKSSIPLIVGGAPVNKSFAEEIGASGYGRNAYEAVKLVDSILN